MTQLATAINVAAPQSQALGAGFGSRVPLMPDKQQFYKGTPSVYFCIHGGLSPHLKSLHQLRNLPRPQDPPNPSMNLDLLWSDPDPLFYVVVGLLREFRTMTEKKLKIVFWSCEENRSLPPGFGQITHDVLQKALNHSFFEKKLSSVKVSCDDAPQTLGEEENEGRIEYIVKITIGEKSDSTNYDMLHLLDWLKDYFYRKAKTVYDHKYTCSLIIMSKDFFDVDFCSAQLRLPTESFSFMNIIDRSLPCMHRNCVVNRDDAKIMDRFFGHAVVHPTLTDFEHDRKQLVVRFPHIQPAHGEKPVCNYVVTLTVRYKNIRRLMVGLQKEKVDGKPKFALELYFHLSCPVTIRRIKLFSDPLKGTLPNLLTKQGDRYTTWNPKGPKTEEDAINESPIFKLTIRDLDPKTYSTLMARLSATTDRALEFRTFDETRDFPFRMYVQSPLFDEACLKKFDGNFKLMYMFEALLSRGAIVKDYLLASENNRDELLNLALKCYRDDKAVALEVLERVLSEIDERLDCQHPIRIFRRIYRQVSRNAETMRQLHEDTAKEGYVRVRKVVITPTRLLYVAPELLMGNRVLRMDPVNYPVEKFLRVVFRDDDGSPIHGVAVGDLLINRFIGQKLLYGIKVAGKIFNYFGSSNSQLRDNGCYFINATVKEIEQFRVHLGSFKIQSAPKMMSRLGQCFTQARETGINLERRYYADDYDLEGGHDSNGDPYTFSDGVGRISLKTAKELGKELNLDGCIPSCFQFRFRGYKGVLAVDTALDNLREWGIRNHVQDTTNVDKRDCWLDLWIKFRPSQKKFEAKRDGQKLEIVKYSSPVQISLNRPVINILDQVSSFQSHALHKRICNRIHFLMDMHLHSLTRSLMDEQKARNKLGEFPKLILYEQITDLNLTKEPFFRGLVRAAVRATLKKLRQKLQIPIPSSMGRAMFGVIDESGQLQHGQVFIRYTKNSFLKHPSDTADRVVLKGPVMITKNPSIVSGDIRMFEAVDLPCLRHLCDVVVFPTHGPRPHTDEMAGSDLDGDEYTVVWDEQLYLDHNELAFDYTSKSHETITTTEEELRQKMAEFFVDYIKQDSIGRIANAFLINSDLFGIRSNICQKIADKHMEAVDFPKTGVPPKPLETKWEEDNPPERPERTPDFMEKNVEPSYISSRLNGQLFRRAKEIDDILSLAAHDDETVQVPLDALITCPGCEEELYMVLATEHYEQYAANVHSIMDCYGIKTEGELFSGHYASLRNRLSDKDNDDMSFYNTTNAIEQRLFGVFGKFRKQFFETEVNGKQYRFEDITTHTNNSIHNGHKDVFRRICNDPPEELQKLACAYYKTTYDSTYRKLLSFPWLAWDVLNVIRRTNSVNCDLTDAKFSFDPLSEKVTQHIKDYIKHRTKGFNQFVAKMRDPTKEPKIEQAAWKAAGDFCRLHRGLDELLFFSCKWAKTSDVLNGTLNELHICLLLIQFGLNYLPTETLESVPYWLQKVDPSKPLDAAVVDLDQQHGGIGKKFLNFLEFLASRQFEMLPFINFMEPGLGYPSAFYQRQWWPLHKAALNAFHQIAFTFRFDCLPATTEQRKGFLDYAPIQQEIEGEPFVIEVPASHKDKVINNKELLNRLCVRSSCTQIVFRPLPIYPGNETVRLYVSCTGDMESINRLRSILSVRPNLNLTNNCRQMSTLMAAAVYEKLTAE